ncbi:MAG: cytochrome c biogenesis CcdA family protein [Anaerolineae bacterium]
MNPDQISALLAAAAGLLSFLSPCVLPLVPGFIGYLGGTSVRSEERIPWWRTFLHAASFVGGFSAVFIALGAGAGQLGALLYDSLPWVQKVGGALLVLLGLHTMGLLKLPALFQERRVHFSARPEWGYLSSLLMGVLFSAGWTPCVGPVLAGILLLASQEQTAARGALLLALYSLGLGIPFLAVGAAFGPLSGWLRTLIRHLNVVSVVSGLLLVGIGLLIFTDSLRILASYGAFWELL